MNIWKALLLVSFLVYTVYCETQEEAKAAEIAEDELPQMEMSDEEANKLEDAPEEEKDDEKDEETQDSSEDQADEEEHEDEEDSNDVEQQSNDEDPTYKRLISRKTLFRFRNRRDHCRTSRRNIKCYIHRYCVRRDYRKRCLRVLAIRKCLVAFTYNCRVCSQHYVRSCYRVRFRYGYGVRCYNSRNYTRCVRRNVRSYNRTVVVYKRYFNVHRKY